MGKPDTAIKMLEDVYEIADYNKQVAHQLAIFYAKEGDEERAAEMMAEIAYNDKNNYIVRENLSKISLRLGDPETALKYAKEAIEINPESPHAWFHKGTALRDLGQVSEEQAAYRNAVKYTFGIPDAHINLTNSLTDEGKFEEAERVLRQATAVFPSNDGVEHAYAYTSYMQGRLDEALSHLDAAIEFGGTNPNREAFRAHLLDGISQSESGSEVGSSAVSDKEIDDEYVAPDSSIFEPEQSE